MAPRRRSRVVKSENIINYENLSVTDVLCPICRSILIEPVTLPCNHGFCSSCFEGTMENANLVCPICRVRIGSWLRSAKKEKKLINQQYWKAINDLFPQQVQNKLSGVEDDIEPDVPVIKICEPGEIRQEYEVEKQKVDEETRKKHEAETKASEKLIQQLTAEEEFNQIVIEEKIRLDEEMAKQLAQKFGHPGPSTSKTNTKHAPNNKKFGPLDKFIKSDKESTSEPKKSEQQTRDLINYATKEYTCRILSLGGEESSGSSNSTNSKKSGPSLSNLSAIKKKIQQIQKIVDTEISSDSSDSIESECRYFKPIDYRHNPPSERKPAIKVPTVRPKKKLIQILPPSGQRLLASNILESAFARISYNLPQIKFPHIISPERDSTHKDNKKSCTITSNENPQSFHINDLTITPVKRKIEDNKLTNGKKLKLQITPVSTKPNSAKSKKELFTKIGRNNLFMNSSNSPPFYGFDKRAINSSDSNKRFYIPNNRNNNRLLDAFNKEESNRILQEKADLEFARKLQEELDKSSHYSTRSRIAKPNHTKRQITLDEIVSFI